MEFLEVEETRVVYLTRLRRPTGQLYLPEAAAKLISRYSFGKFPTIQDLTERRDYVSFEVGKFDDSQIQELRIYGDGFVASARSNSKILKAFISDLLDWSIKELDLEEVPNANPETHYESSLIIRSAKDLASVVGPLSEITDELNKLMKKSDFTARPFQASGFIFDTDSKADGSRRKEPRFLLDRRIGISFAEHTFYSLAPLPTDDHLALLERIESLAR